MVTSPGVLAAVVAAPLALLAILLARPALDATWENQQAHFWLVLGAAALATALGWSITAAARRRRDARLLLISLAFVASSGFLGLHALATPTVLLGPNAGFELATPVGLVVAGAFAAVSSLELSTERANAVVRRSGLLLGGLAALMIAWAVVSLAELPPLDDPIAAEELDGWQLVLAAIGLALYGLAALGFVRLYARRPARFVFAFTLAFAFLAEAMLVIAAATNWQLSWWEWHVLMLGAFAVIGLAARSEWHEERFSALYLDETLAGAKDVSILFADLQGFTSYSERHEPDEVAAMLNAYFGPIVPLMGRAGGEVHQIVGDELMVIFGKAGDQPDHAERAARAALLLQRTAERVRHEHGDWPRFRVGVNSGEVHAGLVGGARGHRKHGIVGDVVNLAARLQSEAPVGGVLIGEETFRRLGTRASVEPLPPRRVKGKDAPVRAYVLHRLDREP
jgi:class 3 adenylate cyclase